MTLYAMREAIGFVILYPHGIFLPNIEKAWCLEIAEDINTWNQRMRYFLTIRVCAEFVKCRIETRSILNNLDVLLGELSRQHLIAVVLDIKMK